MVIHYGLVYANYVLTFLVFKRYHCVFIFVLSMYQTMSISAVLYPELDLWKPIDYNCAELPVGRRNYSSGTELEVSCELPADVLSKRGTCNARSHVASCSRT